MKIIFSPSKKQKEGGEAVIVAKTTSDYEPIASDIRTKLLELSLDQVRKLFKSSEKKSLEIYSMMRSGQSYAAIELFAGTAFQSLECESYAEDQIEYAQSSVRILSALYGSVRPLDRVFPYRLDMTDSTGILGIPSLYRFWNDNLDAAVYTHEVVLNLASTEYSKMINNASVKGWVDVDFFVQKGTELKSVSVYSKQERGLMLNHCIKNKITKPMQLQSYVSKNGFAYNADRSDDTRLVYIKSE